eukprot:ANDGO_02789.mRNA.1 Protein P80
MMEMTMQMTFKWSQTVTILWDSWKTTTENEYVTSWFVIYFATVAFEVLKALWERYEWRVTSTPAAEEGESEKLMGINRTSAPPSALDGGGARRSVLVADPFSFVSFSTILQDGIFSLLHAFFTSVHYLLMLVSMTYNVGLFFAIIGGTMTGNWILRTILRLQHGDAYNAEVRGTRGSCCH